MGNCETCVNSSKTAKGSQGISYDKGKKRRSKESGGERGSRRNSFSTHSNSGRKYYPWSRRTQRSSWLGLTRNACMNLTWLFTLPVVETDETTSYKSAVQKSDFRILKTIGRGTYGKVYLVQHNVTNEIYAMKSVLKDLLIKTDQVQGIRGKSRFDSLARY